MNYNKNSRFLKQNSYQPRFRDYSSSFSGHGGQTKESITTYSIVFPQHRPQPLQGDAGGSEHLRQGHPLPQG